MIQAKDLSMSFSDVLFTDISFLLGNKEKVGLVGLNGCGKTTLMKIIAGVEKQDGGTVELTHEKIAYLPQEFSFTRDVFSGEDKELFVGEWIESLVEDVYSEKWKVDKILASLGVYVGDPETQKHRKGLIDEFLAIHKLSDGQKMKLYLAKILVTEPTILLLDEPTNHLDIEGIEWFETFIQAFGGICIIISHDREFLNNTTNTIFEIDEKKLNIFTGNYDDYLLQKVGWIEKREKAFSVQEKKREHLEKLLKSARNIKSGNKRGKAVKSAKKRIEREVKTEEITAYEEQKLKDINIESAMHNKKLVLDISDLSFAYPKSEPLLIDTHFKIYGNEKVWFYGKNGIGKTTLIKLILGSSADQDQKNILPTSGTIRIGESISWAYFSQDQSHLPKNKTVREYIIEETNIDFSRSFGALEKFLFPKHLQNYTIQELSPGQRARLSFVVFAQKKYDFLILDEPTNHLDIKTKEVIEQAIKEFTGAILLISHDRYFVEHIHCDRAITLQNQKIM